MLNNPYVWVQPSKRQWINSLAFQAISGTYVAEGKAHRKWCFSGRTTWTDTGRSSGSTRIPGTSAELGEVR